MLTLVAEDLPMVLAVLRLMCGDKVVASSAWFAGLSKAFAALKSQRTLHDFVSGAFGSVLTRSCQQNL